MLLNLYEIRKRHSKTASFPIQKKKENNYDQKRFDA